MEGGRPCLKRFIACLEARRQAAHRGLDGDLGDIAGAPRQPGRF
jgi:hypothetical protein